VGTGKIIKAKELVADIRARMTDFELTAKYDLSLRELEAVLERLVYAGVLRRAELEERGAFFDLPENRIQTRQHPRKNLRTPPVIQDMEDPSSAGIVVDLSERGLRVLGIPLAVGDTRRLIIRPPNSTGLTEVVLSAVCRWTRSRDGHDHAREAGLEIVEIKEEDFLVIREMIQLLGFGCRRLRKNRNSAT